MTEEAHPNNQQLFPLSDGEDQRRSLGEIHEEEYSFNSTKYRVDHWQNLNEFQDSNMVQESSQPVQEHFQERIFLEQAQRALGEYQELKESQKQTMNRHPQALALTQQRNPKGPEIESRNRKISKKTKIIEKPNKHTKGFSVYRKGGDMKNLKNISSQVCDYFQSAETTTYHSLFQKFVGSNQDENKNLRRRMYDVINVLSSANILQKKGEVLFKSKDSKKFRVIKKQKPSDIQEKCNKIQQLKDLTAQKLKIIKQKRKIIEELKQKNKNLEKLTKRNKSEGENIPDDEKIHFPLALCGAKKEINFTISQEKHQILLHCPSMQDQNQTAPDFKFIHSQLDLLQHIKFRRTKRNYKPIGINKASHEKTR